MRLTQALGKHNLGRLIKRVWQQTRDRRPYDINIDGKLATNFGIKSVDAMDIIQPKKEFQKIEPEFFYQKIVFDNTHPDWKDEVCLAYRDHNVLQHGTPQAQLLLKTIHVNDELPQQIADKEEDISDQIHNLIKRTIYTTNIFDAHQELLPKRKDPNRPAWNFPRDYGLTEIRRTQNIFKKLLQICECLNRPELAKTRTIIHNGITSVSIERESRLLQFALTFDLALVSTKPLTQIEDQNAFMELDFPDIHPLYPTISLTKTNIYRTEDLSSIEATSPWHNVHTIFISHNSEKVKNLTEIPVTEDQMQARAMIKSFTAAASNARQRFGSEVKHLPEPVTVQCILSNGQDFHFSVLQLNTLDINKTEGIRNFWWTTPTLKLFEQACYDSGKPTLKDYNPEVIKKVFAFYKNT